MRSIGAAQYALDLLLQRVTDPAKKTFGKYLYEHGGYISRVSTSSFLILLMTGTVVADIAKSRAEIESARLLVYSAALQVSHLWHNHPFATAYTGSYRSTRPTPRALSKRLASQKLVNRFMIPAKYVLIPVQFVVPSMACGVIDRAIQAYGAEGVSQDTPLAAMYAGLRTLRIADVRIP